MNPSNYVIRCDEDHFFIGGINTGNAYWGNVTYGDPDINDAANRIYVSIDDNLINNNSKDYTDFYEKYNSILGGLNQIRIHRLWLKRWHPEWWNQND